VLPHIWDRPVIVLYKEDPDQPSREAVTVLRARRLIVLQDEKTDTLTGQIEDFFPLMGDIDSIQSDTWTADRYILCVYDTGEKPFDQPDRIIGVTFPNGLSFISDQKGKRTYHGSIHANRIVVS
jgi:hypothetical protein